MNKNYYDPAVHAHAIIKGSGDYPDISGRVTFVQSTRWVTVSAVIAGLPHTAGDCQKSFHGFHIHDGGSCSGNAGDAFADTLAHYNPGGCEHPHHAGDMPPLLSAGGLAVMSFLTDRFTVDEIIGRTVVIHSDPDDFTSQPSGSSGKKIACGVIRR